MCILLSCLQGWGKKHVRHKKKRSARIERTSKQHQEHHGKVQRGKATYYSRRATGARMSSGKKLHHDSLTCAHRTHPFGTKLKVTNVSNNKYTIVTVEDRGPYSRGKIVDLSYRAAKEIDMLRAGTAVVEIEVYEPVIYPMKPKDLEFLPIEFATEEPDDSGETINITHSIWERKKMLNAENVERKAKQD